MVADPVPPTLVVATHSERIDGRVLLPGVKVDRKDLVLRESSRSDPNVLSELLPLPSVTTSGAVA